MDQKDTRTTKGRAIAGLLINVLVFPGVGSLIAGETKNGIIQLVLIIISIALVYSRTASLVSVIIGGILLMATWIWALVTGIQAIKKSK